MEFGHLTLRKIFKFVATRCQILRLKCTKFIVGWGSAPDPAGRAYSSPPDPLAVFKDLLLREERERVGNGRFGGQRGGEAGKKERGGKRGGKAGKEREETPKS